MFRAVVDTNVLVSSFISPLSFPREIENRWRRGEFVLITSPQIIDEIDRVLHLPRIQATYNLNEPGVQAFVLALSHIASCIAGKLVLKGIAPDPGDDKTISCAVESRADFIVTGDKHLCNSGNTDKSRSSMQKHSLSYCASRSAFTINRLIM